MKRILLALILLTGLSFALTGCKDTCEKAADIIENDCGIEAGESDGDEEEAECEGDAEALAQCTVDYPDATCEFFDDPVANADNDYAKCLSDVLGG